MPYVTSPLPTASLKKIELQNQIDSGVITCHASLKHLIAAYGFEITRNGSNYVGLKDKNGGRGRVYFEFSNPTSKGGGSARRSPIYQSSSVVVGTNNKCDARKMKRDARLAASPGGTIYALIATTAEGCACYIGQTMNFTNRMSAHVRRSGGDRASGPLFAHSRHHGCDVKVIVLEIVPKLEGGIHDFDHYHKAEASWFQAAVDAGCQVPGSQGWANFGDSRFTFRYVWPADEIEKKARPITEVIEERIGACDLVVTPW